MRAAAPRSSMIVDQPKMYEAAVSAMVEAGELARSTRDELLARMAPVFTRREPRLQAGKYIEGLISDLPRKNGWTLAEQAGDGTPDRMQRLLNHASWDHTRAMALVRDFVVEQLAGPDTVAVLDESGQEKKGEHTAGVKRQYVGCAGRVANAVNVVYCTLASARGHALIGARLYLPKDWADDPARRQGAGISEQVVFKTKPQLGIDILADLHEVGALPNWATGDEVYGQNPALRRWCERHQMGYVFAVPRSFMIMLGCGRRMRAEAALSLVSEQGWNYRSCGPGSKGDRNYLWAWIGTASAAHTLLVRRNTDDPTDLAYFYCWSPPQRPATLPMLVAVAGRRWPVEEDFQTGKTHFGLDHSQVRGYSALLRHLTLAIAAAAICTLTAAAARENTCTLPPMPTSPEDPPPDDPGLIPLTVAEIKHLFNHLTQAWHTLTHHLRWIWWRRRHQARARWYHHRARLRRDNPP